LSSAEEEGNRCYGSSAVSEYHQLCFGCRDAETVAGKPVVYSNNCFLEESLGSLVIPRWMLRLSANNIVLRGDEAVETICTSLIASENRVPLSGSPEVFH